MMNHLSDNQLIQAIENLVKREREILHEILVHFRELDRRKLFSKLGFTSLFDYATKHLKYSPDQAGRRIAAMRLLRDVPELESKVTDGSLTLSTLSQAHWHFNKVEHTKEEKKEVLAKLENATKKQMRAILSQEDKVKFIFEVNEEEEKMIERLRGLNPHLNFNELMIKVCKLALEKIDPEKKIERADLRANKKAEIKKLQAEKEAQGGDLRTNKRVPVAEFRVKVIKQTELDTFQSEVKSSATGGVAAAQSFTSAGKVVPVSASNVNHQTRATRADEIAKPTRYISAEVKREVWRSSGRSCQNCKSTFALEYDHIVPFAKGGRNENSNLRLLCRSCNQRKAIEQYGLQKMTQFLRASVDRYAP